MALATLPEGWTRISTAEWERNLQRAYMVDMIQSQYIHQMNITPIRPFIATPWRRTAPTENNSLENYYPDTEDSSDTKYLLTRSETGPPDNDVCGICLENDETPFSEGWAVLQSCGHMFHYPCIIKALEFRTRCPLCRTWASRKCRRWVGHWA
jgi:hypothetical protein